MQDGRFTSLDEENLLKLKEMESQRNKLTITSPTAMQQMLHFSSLPTTKNMTSTTKRVPPSKIGVKDVTDNDVLSGRGGGTNLHPGNRSYRALIYQHCNSYNSASKQDKPQIARVVVQLVRNNGGRFLRKDNKDGLYYEIGDEVAREKTSQALRHRTFEMRSLQAKQKQQQQQQQQQQLENNRSRPPMELSMVPNAATMLLPGTTEVSSQERAQLLARFGLLSSEPKAKNMTDSERSSAASAASNTNNLRLWQQNQLESMFSAATSQDFWQLQAEPNTTTNPTTASNQHTTLLQLLQQQRQQSEKLIMLEQQRLSIQQRRKPLMTPQRQQQGGMLFDDANNDINNINNASLISFLRQSS